MKRALLIAGGTVGGLGAVLAITPPQISSSSSTLALGNGAAPSGVSGGTQATTAAATTTTAKVPTTTKKATSSSTTSSTTKSASATSGTSASPKASASASASATPTAAKTTAPATKNVNGTFTGDAINVGYGIVQVQITVNNGKITDAQAIQAPSGRNDRFTQMSVPVLREKTLAAQGSNITAVSGASYTSYGWYKSLVSALSKAGL